MMPLDNHITSDASPAQVMAFPNGVQATKDSPSKQGDPGATLTAIAHWHPESWRSMPLCLQQPTYHDQDLVQSTLGTLSMARPVVGFPEVLALKQQIAAAAEGGSFILHGGDCAELMTDVTEDILAAKVTLHDELGRMLSRATGRSVVRLGRIAGQFAKPRSQDVEVTSAGVLPIYRGDLINGRSIDPQARIHDPRRLLSGYAAARAMRDHLPGHLYTSHEGLHLEFEQALTREIPADCTGAGPGYFASSGHLLWIGERTRQLDGAHVEFMRGIANPIACKIGPARPPEDIVALCRMLNPQNEPGRLTLITRLGVKRVNDYLPRLIEAISTANIQVTWSIDPMHGQTVHAENGVKTRLLSSIIEELEMSLAVHERCGTVVGGVHLEWSPDDVTECLGGGGVETLADLERNYQSACDPRLNAAQCRIVIERLAELL